MFRWFLVLSIMAAFLPNCAKAAQTTTLTGQPIIEGPQAQLAPTARVWIDESSIALGGNWGIFSPGAILNQLRDQSYISGKIGVLLAAGQVGQTVTHRCFVTGTVEVSEEAKTGLIIVPKAGLVLGKDKLVGKASLTLTIFNLATGQVEAMVKGEGRADRSSASSGAIVIGRYGVGQVAAKVNPEEDLAQKAISQAVGSLIKQLPTCTFILPAVVPVPLPVVTTNQGCSRQRYSDMSHGF